MWLGNAGSLSASYDIGLVLKAMRIADEPSLRLVLMSDGPDRRRLERESEGLIVSFARMPSYDRMCGVLAACDIVVNPIMERSVASIINKHADYAASGKATLNTQRSEEYMRLIDSCRMGYNCDGIEELAGKLRILVANKNLREQLGKGAQWCAADCFDRRVHTKHLAWPFWTGRCADRWQYY